MENTIILNSGQKIEVLFQDEVSLNIDCALRYIESGKKELDDYVQNTAKPTLDDVITKAQTDMEQQIAQGVIDAAQAASISAADAISSSISQAEAEIDSYVDTNILPDLNSAVASAAQSAQDAASSEEASFQSATSSSNYANNSQASANSASQSALSAAQSAQSAADSAALAIEKSSFGNIGDIKYTTRTDVPNGGAWCDGAEYTKQAFPDIYQMLVDGKLQKTDYTTFAEDVSDNGSCGFFALDTVNEKFKVPLLKDVYIKAGDTPSSFNVSRSPSTYQDGAKVNPDHVVYRAYVVLYSSAAEASEAQAAEFMTALGGKANVGLDNVTPAQSFKDMSVAWNTPDYDRAVSISITSYGMEYVPQFDGYIEYRVYFGNAQHFFITGSGVSENSDSISGGAISGSTVSYLASSIRVAKGKSYYIFNTGTVQKLQFIPCKGVNTNA